jgi:hypothetical protein
MAIQIQLRRATAAQWTTANTVLAQGEPAIETDTQKIKIGDGSTAWNSLVYYQTTPNAVYTPRVLSQTTTTSQTALSWSSASYDQINITCANTSATCNVGLDGNSSPANGQKVLFKLKDSGTVCSIAFAQSGANRFRAVGTTLPTSTYAASKITYMGCVYNSADVTWDVIAVGLEA